MKIVEYYKKPERRMAGVVVAFCLIVIAVLFILKTIGFGTGLIFPDWLCHVLWLGGSWALLCVIAAMFLYPLRYFIPFREKSLAEAFEAGFKTLFALLFVAFGVLFLFGDVVGMIEDGEKRYQNGGTDYRRYSCYEELPQDEFSDLLVPRDAVDIRRIYDGGFKYLNCSISSEIDMEGLKRFALLNDYHFEVCKKMPMWCPNDCVKKELVLDETDPSNYLYCLAQKRELGQAEISFVYDIKHRRLYGVYMFD